MDDNAIRDLVDRVLVDEFEIDPGDVVAGARLREDLELDSLDRVDLVVTLEKALGARFVDDEIKRVVTVADLRECVARAAGRAP